MDWQICRICEINTDLVDICSTDGDMILHKLKIFKNVFISINDVLPNYVCTSCIEKLDNCKKFYDLIQHTRKKLETLLTIKGVDVLVTSNPIKDQEMVVDENISIEMTTQSLSSKQYKNQAINNNSAEKYKSADSKVLTSLSIEIVGVNLSNYENIDPCDDTNNLDQSNVITIDKNQLECSECDIQFNTNESLKSHLNRVHTAEFPYSCLKCDKEFGAKAALVRHMFSHTTGKEKKYQRGKSNKTFLHSQNLIRNKNKFSRLCELERNLICKICKKKFTTLSLLEDHKQEHYEQTNGIIFDCNQCSNIYDSKAELDYHITLSHNEKSYKCKYCSDSFYDAIELSNHLKLHAKRQLTFTCDLCKKNFPNNIILQQHIKKLHNTKPYTCSICEITYCNKFLYDEHLNDHLKCETLKSETFESETFKCEICSKLYIDKHNLQIHMNSHQDFGEKPLSCEICTKNFKRKTAFLKHKKIHDTYQTNPFKCQICVTGYETEERWLVHRKIHKNLICFLCKETLNSLEDLKNHMKLHISTESGHLIIGKVNNDNNVKSL